MTYRNLSSFLAALRARGELFEVEAEVEAHLEIAEIHRRVIAAGGPALLFKRVKGKSFPVVTNLFGTAARVDLAFGSRPKAFVARVAELPEELLPPSFGKLWQLRGLGREALRIGLKEQRRAPVLTHQVTGADLTQLPALTSWSEDGGPFLTLPLVHTVSPSGRPDNLGMYRVQIHDAHETGMHFQIGKGGGFHLAEWEAEGRAMPLNVYLGGPPALILSAIAPLPENVPELLLASLVLGEKLGRARVPEPNPPIVAEAEFCLVGEVPAGVRRPEGPFGDHYGYYSLQHDYPVFRPRAIYHRAGAVFPATVVGKPRQEDFFLGDYLQELLLPLLPKVMPGVRDLWSYGETGYHSLAAAVVRERYAREAMSTAFRVLGEGQLALTKVLLAIDQPLDLRDFPAVLTHVLERADLARDLLVLGETSMDTLDYTGPSVNRGSKAVLVGLGAAKRTLPRAVPSGLDGRVRAAAVFSPGCLVVETAGFAEARTAAAEIAQLDALQAFPLVVVVDSVARATRSSAAFLWTTFTRFEPAADLHARTKTVERNRVAFGGPLVIDARMKPWYPAELFGDPTTQKRVDERWRTYFPGSHGAKVQMGDSGLAHLG